MIQIKNLFQRTLLAALLFMGSAFSVWSAETEQVDIHVQILATKSLSINTTSYDFGSLNVNQSSVSANSVIVTNDSTALIQTYTLSATDAISNTLGTDWTLSTSTGTDQFALGAQFSDTRPADLNSAWDQDHVSNSATTCTDSIFGNGTLSESGQDVMPLDTRNLWFRIQTPSSVTDGGSHTVTVTLSVL